MPMVKAPEKKEDQRESHKEKLNHHLAGFGFRPDVSVCRDGHRKCSDRLGRPAGVLPLARTPIRRRLTRRELSQVHDILRHPSAGCPPNILLLQIRRSRPSAPSKAAGRPGMVTSTPCCPGLICIVDSDAGGVGGGGGRRVGVGQRGGAARGAGSRVTGHHRCVQVIRNIVVDVHVVYFRLPARNPTALSWTTFAMQAD